MVVKRKREIGYDPDYAICPGETLKEIIEELGMDQKELALRLEMAHKTINQIIHGKAPITYSTAISLERVTNVPASFWVNREVIFRERLAKIKDLEHLRNDLDWLEDIPTSELRSRGFLKTPRKSPELLNEVLSFFGMSSTSAWRKHWDNFAYKTGMSARKSAHHKTQDAALATWIRLGEIEAQRTDCELVDLKLFKKNIHQIRELTTLSPTKFVPQMTKLCALAGVALVLVPKMKNVPWYGASWWISPRKAVIELNLRGKSEDQFWFSFFHEAGHILLHSKKDVYINRNAEDDPLEKEANEFAVNTLFPKARISIGDK